MMVIDSDLSVVVQPILTLPSASVPPFLSAMLASMWCSLPPPSPPSVIGISQTALAFRTLLFPLWVLRLKRAEVSARAFVFSNIWCMVCERRARSLIKSRSSKCIQSVCCEPSLPLQGYCSCRRAISQQLDLISSLWVHCNQWLDHCRLA